MTVPILQTKLYIPPYRPVLVPRAHLVEKINAGLDCKLTLISAPAGFGKTTLLAEWVASSSRPIAWISLDDGDNDQIRFLTYLIVAIQGIHDKFGQTTLELLQSPQPSSTENILTALINEIAELQNPFLLILDDYHVISDRQVHRTVTYLIEYQPRQMHVILSTRADPPWPLSRYRGRGELNELRVNDLRFSVDETLTFLNEVMNLKLSTDDVATLDERTEGWIAGLQMAALSLQGRKDTTTFMKAFSGSHRYVLDYLLEEVLLRQSEAVREFLLKTSILNRMTAPLCNIITGRQDSQDILRDLEAANLFLLPLDDERGWYRYHHLFVSLLRGLLGQEHPHQKSELHIRASQWLESQGLLDEAIEHAVAAKDIERATDLIEQYAMDTIIQGNLTTVARWLESLPSEQIRARPWLCGYQAWVRHWTGQREDVEECLVHVENTFLETRGDPDAAVVLSESEYRHLLGTVGAIRAISANHDTSEQPKLEIAQRAMELLPEGDYMRGINAIALANAYENQGDLLKAQAAYAEGCKIAKDYGYRSLEVSLTCYLGSTYVRQARLHEAYRIFSEALDKASTPSGSKLPAAGYALVKLGELEREWNQLETAEVTLTKGLEICKQWGQVDFLAEGYVAMARLQLAKGDAHGAHKSIDEVDALSRTAKLDPFIICWSDNCRLRLWLPWEDLSQGFQAGLIEATNWATASGLQVDGELSYLADLDHINLSRFMVAQGMHHSSKPLFDQALTLLERIVDGAESAGWIHQAIEARILQALAFQGAGNPDGALRSLTEAIARAEPGGYIRLFTDEGSPMQRMLSTAVRRDIAPGHMKVVLDSLKKPMIVPREVVQHPTSKLVEPLSERELQVLRYLKTNLSSTEIADELYISPSTVRTHIKNIYSKLDVHRRYDAVERAKELSLL
ncbi:MAG: LuxR C-terminal-related transcriptional regulator [Anaerolineales bacterium]